MEAKKVTYEEALARFKRSLKIKHEAEKRMKKEWEAMGLTEMTARALTSGKP